LLKFYCRRGENARYLRRDPATRGLYKFYPAAVKKSKIISLRPSLIEKGLASNKIPEGIFPERECPDTASLAIPRDCRKTSQRIAEVRRFP